MRVALPNPFAEDRVPGPKRNQPDLRLISGEVPPDTAPTVRRLAVIVAADMVDYTRHMADDEAGTHARCTALWRNIVGPGIARHGGRIYKHTGDGFMAEFSSATLAVWFAVRFQRAVRAWNARRARERPIEFRVGINLGDVIADAHDVFGHSVNIASRLEAIARPGGVLVSHAVFASVRESRLSFDDAGELSLKNVSEPVRGFHARLSKPAGRMGRATGLEPVTSRTTTWRSAS
jgi:class 3 adenylate cyclase